MRLDSHGRQNGSRKVEEGLVYFRAGTIQRRGIQEFRPVNMDVDLKEKPSEEQ